MCEKDRCDQKCSDSSPASAPSGEGKDASASENSAASRPPNTKSVGCDCDPDEVCGDCVDIDDGWLLRRLKTVDENTDHRVLNKVKEFVAKYPELAALPVTEHGDLSSKYVEYVEKRFEIEEYKFGEFRSVEQSEVVPENAYCWADAVAVTLERYLLALETELGFVSVDGEEFWKDASNRWKPEYQEEQFASMHGFVRRAVGGDLDDVDGVPDGVDVPGWMEDPKLVLITRSASSVPGGCRTAPVDHDRDLADSWGNVYNQLRNYLEDVCKEWVYDARSEPHGSKRAGAGYGKNVAYTHEHVVLLVDSDLSCADLRAAVRPAVESHVRNTPGAGEEAHDLDHGEDDWADGAVSAPRDCGCESGCADCIATVQVFDVDCDSDELDNVAAYVASYASIEPVDLFERPAEYVAWASLKDAGNTRTWRRSEKARELAEVDLCDIRGLSENGHQAGRHGDRVVRAAECDAASGSKPAHEKVCAYCGESHGIEQPDRVPVEPEVLPDVAADGGAVVGSPGADGDVTFQEFADARDDRAALEERWPGADAGASVGSPVRAVPVAEYIRENYGHCDVKDAPEIAAEMAARGFDVTETIARRVLTGVDALVEREFPDAEPEDLPAVAGSLQEDPEVVAACLAGDGIDPVVREYLEETFDGIDVDVTAVPEKCDEYGFKVTPEIVAAVLCDDGVRRQSFDRGVEEPEWELDAIVRNRGDDDEEVKTPGGSGVEMVRVATPIDEYEGLFTEPVLREVEKGAVPITWRFRDGLSVGCSSWSGAAAADYIEKTFGVDTESMTIREAFEYVRPRRSMPFGPVDRVWEDFDREGAFEKFADAVPVQT